MDLTFYLHLIPRVNTFMHILTSFARIFTLITAAVINIYRGH